MRVKFSTVQFVYIHRKHCTETERMENVRGNITFTNKIQACIIPKLKVNIYNVRER